uniref:60S ribosomal protein L18a n=1 Tax=Chromera velia CCMP2878 TaxID=1169474 RepID=A0A0G4HYD4_9ALVE|eukprot:Cvel_9467.t1-p1 / transcript=Cvel_9467.t1 / gene=Cvel_9467 / organism=Chromera_velia_CCMP2878 / gene_product=60S ribosomal protein L18a, putative / transcript_product=60S ribosomal protein L18a, putative / location=Cvel_scaffold546:63404-67204(+) / protein_length=185 / sequence_SO=supercontig / SO=protein_coding / is_pseudo=false
MVKRAVDPTLKARMHQYAIVGRGAPTQRNPDPKVYRMKVFARDHVLAKSKFWYFMKKLNKVKRQGGEVLSLSEITEKNPSYVKNIGMWIRYKSRSGTHNMYKEYRALSQTEAVGQMYAEMAGRHRAQCGNISIIKIAQLKKDECRRKHVTAHHTPAKFPLLRRIPMVPKAMRTTFNARRCTTFLG